MASGEDSGAVPPAVVRVRRRKSSLRVTLVLIGAAGVSACGGDPEPEIRRNVYASLEDCRADWDRAELCERAEEGSSGSRSGTSSTASGTRYFGPRYYSSGFSSSDRPRASSRSIGTTTVSRGGFGSSSASHSSGS